MRPILLLLISSITASTLSIPLQSNHDITSLTTTNLSKRMGRFTLTPVQQQIHNNLARIARQLAQKGDQAKRAQGAAHKAGATDSSAMISAFDAISTAAQGDSTRNLLREYFQQWGLAKQMGMTEQHSAELNNDVGPWTFLTAGSDAIR